jgi:cardiolipin synthase A/B
MFYKLRRVPIRSIFLFYAAILFFPPLFVSMILLAIDLWRKRFRSQGYFVSWREKTPVCIGDAQDTEVQLYTYGEDLFAAMLQAIEGARERVFLETYIWKGDRIGRKFKDALTQAAKRGVDVFVIYDSLANLVVPASFKCFSPMIHVIRYPLLPSLRHPFSLSTYARDHRKLLIIDGQIAFIGGYNIGETYACEWRDTHARISGPGALEVENTFIDFWNSHKNRHQPTIPERTRRSWDPHLHIHRNDPPMMIFPIRMTYLEAIDRATHHIYLTNAYFLPDRILLRALIDAAKRGIDVRILLPAHSNHIIVDWLSHDYYEECLRAGIHLLLYQKAMVHAKTATIDGIWSTVGTANLDRLSMVGNFEVNAEFFDVDIARQMERIFLEDASHAHELELASWLQRPLLWKLSEKALHRLRPFL